jgi:NADH-quinone oxidoreductase subunit L
MTFPLQALAIGAVIAGFVGIPAALGGGNAIEHFLEPSYIADRGVRIADSAERTADSADHSSAEIRNPQSAVHNEEEHVPAAVELGLMAFSVLVALAGIGAAYRFYVTAPEISESLATRFAGAHRTLSNKYYVDELYQATVISGTFAAARGLWTVDRNVVNGAVDGTAAVTRISSSISGLTDSNLVDGLVNLIGLIVQESSHAFRRLQTGLVQNYAMVMLFGIFAFVTVYLLVR